VLARQDGAGRFLPSIPSAKRILYISSDTKLSTPRGGLSGPITAFPPGRAIERVDQEVRGLVTHQDCRAVSQRRIERLAGDKPVRLGFNQLVELDQDQAEGAGQGIERQAG
jgi:hypothetical protein